jgi:hypothetical protein
VHEVEQVLSISLFLSLLLPVPTCQTPTPVYCRFPCACCDF